MSTHPLLLQSEAPHLHRSIRTAAGCNGKDVGGTGGLGFDPGSALTGFARLDKLLLKFLMLQFPHPQNGNNNTAKTTILPQRVVVRVK